MKVSQDQQKADLDGVKDRNLEISLSDGYDAKADGLLSDGICR